MSWDGYAGHWASPEDFDPPWLGERPTLRERLRSALRRILGR